MIASMTRSTVAQLLEVVLDVADRDEARALLSEERRGARLEGLVEAAGGEAVARGAVLLLGVGQVRRDDVESRTSTPALAK